MDLLKLSEFNYWNKFKVEQIRKITAATQKARFSTNFEFESALANISAKGKLSKAKCLDVIVHKPEGWEKTKGFVRQWIEATERLVITAVKLTIQYRKKKRGNVSNVSDDDLILFLMKS